MHATDENLALAPQFCNSGACLLLIKGILGSVWDEKTDGPGPSAFAPCTPALTDNPVHVAPRYKRQRALHLEAASSVFLMGSVPVRCRQSKKFTGFSIVLLALLKSKDESGRIEIRSVQNRNSTEQSRTAVVKERQFHMCKHCGRQFRILPTVALPDDEIVCASRCT